VSPVSIDLSTSEEIHHSFKNVAARFPLHDGKLRSDLPSEGHLSATIDGAAEAAFSTYESHYPSNVRESFLLIFRRDLLAITHRRIVTARHALNPMGRV
jgi:hypothetical protein